MGVALTLATSLRVETPRRRRRRGRRLPPATATHLGGRWPQLPASRLRGRAKSRRRGMISGRRSSDHDGGAVQKSPSRAWLAVARGRRLTSHSDDRPKHTKTMGRAVVQVHDRRCQFLAWWAQVFYERCPCRAGSRVGVRQYIHARALNLDLGDRSASRFGVGFDCGGHEPIRCRARRDRLATLEIICPAPNDEQ